MADKQYYVKISFEFGTDMDGVLEPKNTGEVSWTSMPDVDAVGLQNYAVIPALNDMAVKAGELGLNKVGLIDIPTPGEKPKGNPNK
jgi:hypothetical protein